VTTLAQSSDAAVDLRALVEARERGYSLEAPFYTSPDVFQLDIEAVWARTWLFVANQAEIAEPGDYVTVQWGRTR
jgi:glycine betaine catabolism A